MVDRRRVISAQQRLAEIEGFYIHFACYALVLAGLTGLNAYTGDAWWVQWVFLGWGIGVVAHAFAVFGSKPRFVTTWERRKFRELVRR
jgi:hypothetical protein